MVSLHVVNLHYGKSLYGEPSYGKASYARASYGKSLYGKSSFAKLRMVSLCIEYAWNIVVFHQLFGLINYLIPVPSVLIQVLSLQVFLIPVWVAKQPDVQSEPVHTASSLSCSWQHTAPLTKGL